MAPEDVSYLRLEMGRMRKILLWSASLILAAAATMIVLATKNQVEIDNIQKNYVSKGASGSNYSNLYVLLSEHIAMTVTYNEANDEDKKEIKAGLIAIREQINEHLQYHIDITSGGAQRSPQQPDRRKIFAER